MDRKRSASRILELADKISAFAIQIQEILDARHLPCPSFAEDASSSLPEEARDAQDIVLDATAELHDLLLEPVDLIHRHCAHNNSVWLQAVVRLGIADMVPAAGRVSFAGIGKQASLTEQHVARILRHAMTMRVFDEPEPGLVAHTRASKALCDPIMRDWARAGTDEIWPAAVKMVDALQKWPASQEPNETGFSLANSTNEDFYTVIGRSPERAGRFANAMKIFTTSPKHDLSFVTSYYDWASLGAAQVVDVGGAQGHVAVELVTHFSDLSIVVQDNPSTIENADARLPRDLRGRIHFMAHDFFSPQTVQADVYLFRWILHNWSDKYCILLLRALICMLKPGVKIIIQDTIMPEPQSIPLWKEKDLRAADLTMGAVFNSRERTLADWKVLLKEADTRFLLMNVIEPKGSALGILEIVWNKAETR